MTNADQPGPRDPDVSRRVRELASVVPILDLAQPKAGRRMSLDESARVILDRYGEALDLLDTL